MYPSLVCLLFALFFTSVATTKALRLYLNAHVFPTGVFVFCLPAFITTDIVLISLLWLLLRRKNGWVALTGFAVGGLIWYVGTQPHASFCTVARLPPPRSF
jgi:hypothetical protein